MDDQEISKALSIIKSGDFNFGERLKEQTEKVRKDKEGLLSGAKIYNERYYKEIQEGTEKVKLLIEEGKKKGKSAEESMAIGIYTPQFKTPILNFLYFLTHENPDAHKINYNRLDEDKELDYEVVRDRENFKHGHKFVEEKTSDKLQDMTSFLYAGSSHDIYKRIKKLKTMAIDPNGNSEEKRMAFEKALEMCEKLDLDYNRISTELDD